MALFKVLVGLTLLTTSAATVGAESKRLYFCDREVVYRSGIDGSNLTVIFGPAWDCVTSSLDVDVAGGKMYWSFSCITPLASYLVRANLDGSNQETIAAQPDSTTVFEEYIYRGVAFDPATRRVYWARADCFLPNQGFIERTTGPSTAIETVLSGSETGSLPWGIEIEPIRQEIFWTVIPSGGDSVGAIRQADSNGQSAGDLVTGLGDPRRVALDLTAGKIYWTDSGTGKIQRADLSDGQNVEDLVEGLSTPIGIDLDLDTGKMYWTDAGPGKIQRANLDGTNVEDVLIGLAGPAGLRVVNDDPTNTGISQPSDLQVGVLQSSGDEFTFHLQVPAGGRVVLDIFAVTGRRVVRVIDRDLPRGIHFARWEGVDDYGRRASSGIYVYRINTDAGESRTGKFAIVR